MEHESCALVGAAGGVGTTRLSLECAAAVAGAGRDIAVLDAAYGTQGLADHVPGRIDPDMTALCVDDAPLGDGLVDLDVAGAGRLSVCPVRAPFERLARAKAPTAAEAFADRIAEATRAFDAVLVDVPPVAANQAVAAVTAADRVAVVCDAERAAAALPRARDRLADVGADHSLAVVTGTDQHPDADVAVPTFESDWPAVSASADAHDTVAAVVEEALGADLPREGDDGLLSSLFA